MLDGQEVVEEITGANITSYIGPGLISEIAGSTRTIFHPDGLGSTRAMTDAEQAVELAAIYDAWGNIEAPAGGISSFGYAGQFRYYADLETGLSHLKARYYGPGVGRFVSKDPIGYDGGWKLYRSTKWPYGFKASQYGAIRME